MRSIGAGWTVIAACVAGATSIVEVTVEDPAFAQLDHDALLTEAPAVPAESTIRIAGMGVGVLESRGGHPALNGFVLWSPISNFALDVGVFGELGKGAGPTARVRYQILNQRDLGVDLAAGLRMKTVGFHPDQGEVEALLAVGKNFGALELALNGVFGFETGGEQGKDVEARLLAAYRIGETARLGIDARFRAEIEDEEEEAGLMKIGRDFDFIGGPAFSWLPDESIQVQALAGVSAPFRSDLVGPAAMLAASVDF